MKEAKRCANEEKKVGSNGEKRVAAATWLTSVMAEGTMSRHHESRVEGGRKAHETGEGLSRKLYRVKGKAQLVWV